MEKMKISLLDIVGSSTIFGSKKGQEVYAAIIGIIKENPNYTVFEICLDGIEAVDATFARESVVNAAKFFRGQKAFLLTSSETSKLSSSWSYAARVKDQPLLVLLKGSHHWIGDTITTAKQELVDYVYQQQVVRSGDLAVKYDLPVAHASTKLRKLFDEGYLLRKKQTSSTGGVEYTYHPISQYTAPTR